VSTGNLCAVRHGPVHEKGLCYGQSEVTPIIDPKSAAHRVIDALSAHPRIDIVWTSPYLRCLHVAQLLANHFHSALCVDQNLNELSFGQWEGLTWNEIESEHRQHFQCWAEDWKNAAPPGGEGLSELTLRIQRWSSTLDPEKNHLLVGHAGPIRALRVLVKGWSWDQAMQQEVVHLMPEFFTL